MKLTCQDVEKVAALAKLEYSKSEIAAFTEQLGRIVEFVERLSDVPTEGVEPLAHPLDVHSATRLDELQPGLSHEAALANAPSRDEDFFLVPPVMSRS